MALSNEGNHATPEEAQRHAALSTPMKRIGKVEEMVATVLWLCSDHTSFITGATVPIDGGQQAGLKLSRMYRPGQPMKAAES